MALVAYPIGGFDVGCVNMLTFSLPSPLSAQIKWGKILRCVSLANHGAGVPDVQIKRWQSG